MNGVVEVLVACRPCVHRTVAVAVAWAMLVGGAWTFAQESADGDASVTLVADMLDGAPAGIDGFGNEVGFITWQDGTGAIELSTVAVAEGDDLAWPTLTGEGAVLQVRHTIGAWGGFTHAFADDAVTRWVPRNLAAHEGIRFWFLGTGTGGTVQFDLFDNRSPDVVRDSAERFALRFVDDVDGWRLIEVPFSKLFRRSDFQPAGAPDDGLTLSEAWGWALGFPPGEGVSYVAQVEAYGTATVAAGGGPTVQWADPLYTAVEGERVTVRALLDAPSEEAVSVRAFVQGDTATPLRDLVTRSELLVFPPGVTEASFEVSTVEDTTFEGDEFGRLTLGTPIGATVGFQRLALIRIVDDEAFDPDLLVDFDADGRSLAGGAAASTVEQVELVRAARDARPEQDGFEVVSRIAWTDEEVASVAFDRPVDATGAEAITFWYRGEGSGRTVRLRIADGGTEPGPWTTAWEDTFDGPAGAPPDPAVWTPEIGDGTAQGIPGWGNAELQTYTGDPSNVSLDGMGRLAITAREAEAGAFDCSYGPCRYTSARIVTRDAVEVEYGRVEARIQLPYGRGIWSAFWLLGSNIATVPWPDSGEIDIMENVGHERSTVHGTVHGPGYSGGNGIGRPFRLTRNEAFSDAFHDFAIEWEPGVIRWYVDDVPYSTVDAGDVPRGSAWVYDHPFFMILNVAVGGNWPGSPDASTTFPQTMVVDHVRILERSDVAERFEATFVDDVEGWKRVTLPVRDFVRSAVQPTGAADDGFGLERWERLEWVLPAGGGVAWIDEVRIERP